MARYCFYCGRELEDSEKCYCRARTRAESAAKTAASSSNVKQDPSTSDPRTGSEGGQRTGTNSATYTQGTTSSASDSNSTATSSDAKSKRQTAKAKRQAAKAKRKADRERMRAARAEGKRRTQAEKNRRRQSYSGGAAGFAGSNRTSGVQDLRAFGRELLQLFLRPADAIKSQAIPYWSLSHTIFLIASVLLGGAHISFANRWLYSLLFNDQLNPPALDGVGLYFSGVLMTGFFLLLYAAILWALARFLFRQGGLPFSHTLAVGKTAWAYLTLFMLVALPTTMQGGFFGLLLVLMGFAFSCLVYARSIAVITHLSDNQALNLTVVSLFLFTSLFSASIAVFQTLLLP